MAQPSALEGQGTESTDTAAPEGADQQKMDIDTAGSGSTADVPEETRQAKAATMCGVCEKAPFKYKCPRCYLPYCSVACNKIHRENHPPDPEPAPKAAEPQPTSAVDSEPPSDPPPSSSGRHRAHRFLALQESEKLQWLFRKYPRLPGLLLDIHAATQEPSTEKPKIPASLLKDLPPQNSGWDQDKGITRGKEALRKARELEGEDGEAVREYSELVLYLMEDSQSTRG